MPQTRHYEMKDSGVEWIGKMPSNWQVKYLFQLVSQVKNKNNGLREKNLLSLSYGKIKRKDIETTDGLLPASFDGYNIIEEGDIVMRLTDLQNDHTSLRIGRATERGIITSAYTTVRPSKETSPFLYLALHSFDVKKGFYGMGAGVRQGLNYGEVKKVLVPVPPLSEQTAIAAYLDEKCATIDAIIVEAKSSIEGYKSWKASVIFETVTKGLNPNAEMKDSGVEWIGSIPKAWQYVPLKYLASCNDEVLTEATPEDYTFDYIDIGSVHTGNGIGMCERMQFKDAPSRARRIVRDGDIIVSTVRTYLKAIAQVGNYDVPHIASTGFAVIRTKNANASFLKYALLSDNFVSQVEADSVGISYPAINATQIMAFKIPVPSIAEQTDIALYLDDKCAAIDGVIAEKEALIGELESYKKSLIFETVTGKRRVC